MKTRAFLFQTISSTPGENQLRKGMSSSVLTWWTAAAFATIVGFSRISYGLLLPSIQANMGGSLSSYGVVNAANFAGYLLGTLALPLLPVRFHKHHMLLNSGALLLMNGLMVGSALSTNLAQLSLWRFLVGFFSALALVLSLSLLLERVPPEVRGRASGITWMGASLGVIISGLVAPLILNNGSPLAWRWVWIGMGASGIVVSIGLHCALHRSSPYETHVASPRNDQSILDSLWVLLRPRSFLFATLSYLGFGFGYIIYLTYVVVLVMRQGLPSPLIGLFWAAMGCAGAISGGVWGRAIDRKPTGLFLALSLLLGAVSALSVLSQNVLLEAIGAALFGLSVFLGPPLIVTFLLRRIVLGERYPAVYSLLNTLFGIGQTLGPLAGGFLVERWGLVPGIAFSSAVLLAAALSALCHSIIQSHHTWLPVVK